jgi:hypothetical protein
MARQRALVERAVQLGWARERAQLLDEDLGRSGARTQRRSGFERLLSAVALGEVGIILALEVSRISRDNRNWYPSARYLRHHPVADCRCRGPGQALFARFDELGSIHRVHSASVEQQFRVAVRAGRGALLT